MIPDIVIRGGGDIATGVIQKLVRTGHRVLVVEQEEPLSIRRTVSLSEAIKHGTQQVEDLFAKRLDRLDDLNLYYEKGYIPLMVDPKLECIDVFRPQIVIDATLSKKNIGTNRAMANSTIALGPGYEAGKDVDIVIETNRGHHLGRLYFKGYAIPNTGVPGLIGGYRSERVYYAPSEGRVSVIEDIGSTVEAGQPIASVGRFEIKAQIGGLVRGMLPDGIVVEKGIKMADIDPRAESIDVCYEISDKARAIGGAVLEAVGICVLQHKLSI